MRRKHELKTWPDSFRAILTGVKRYEVRPADRGFEVDDLLWLREYIPEDARYTGRAMMVRVSYMTPPGKFGVPEGLCVMGIVRVGRLRCGVV